MRITINKEWHLINILKIKKILKIKEGKDISGLYIVLLAVIYGTYYDLINYVSTEPNYIEAFVKTIYLIPVVLVVYIFEHLMKIEPKLAKEYLIILFIYFILSMFFSINASYGTAIILSCSVIIFLILIFCRIANIVYIRPLLHLAVVSFFSFVLLSIFS